MVLSGIRTEKYPKYDRTKIEIPANLYIFPVIKPLQIFIDKVI